MSLNCRSIRNKTHEVMDFVIENEVDVAFFQETWLKKSDSVLFQEIREYGFEILTERKYRASDIGGGLAVVYRNCLSMKKIKVKQYPSFETQVVQINTNCELLTIGNVYFPGYSEKHRFTQSMFIADFEDFLQEVMCCRGHRIIVGDFNIHMNDGDRVETRGLKSVIWADGFANLVTTKTHELGGLIDLVLCHKSASHQICKVDVLLNSPDLSDHYPILIETRYKTLSKKSVVKLNYQKCSVEHVEKF